MACTLVLTTLLVSCSDDQTVTATPVSIDSSAVLAATDQAMCTWPTAGGSPMRWHATACADGIDATDLSRLSSQWFFPTRQEVTGAPAVDDDHLYFGDWSGRVYAVDRDTGTQTWTHDIEVQPRVYAGQITATPTLATINGRDVVVVGGGRSVDVLDRATGALVWHHGLGDPTNPADDTEIEGGTAVSGDLVVVAFDVHNDPALRAGVVGIDLSTGATRWYWDPEDGLPSGGCGDIWGAPAVDADAARVFVGTANCPKAESWGRYAEAIVSLDLATGAPQWSYQPHEKGNLQDWDFAGAPNLFVIDGRAVVGLGNKDGHYYVVDRATGKLVWSTQAQRQKSDGDGFSFGGFIGASAVSSGVIAGGTAIGDCPCVTGFAAKDGTQLWRNSQPSATYAAAGATPDLLFLAGVDQTIRAFRLTDGKVMWSSPIKAISSSGPALAGRDLYLGVGFREPGTDTPSAAAGVQAFRARRAGESAPSTTTSTTLATGPPVTALQAQTQECVGSPCALPTTLKDPPPGSHPKISLEVTPDPLAITVHASGLGDPVGWVRAGSAAAKAGATVYGVFVSSRDDQPEKGSVICTFTAKQDGCTGTTIRNRADRYTRLTLVAFADSRTPPTLQDGADRFVTTKSFDPPLVPEG